MTQQQQPGHRVAPLLDLDPDLGQFLEGDQLEEARRQLFVRVRRLAPGAWDTAALTVADPGHVGLLVLDGVIARDVLAADIVSTELLGPGEVLRPWEISPDAALLRVSVRWSVLAEARLAVLDRRVASHLGAYPEITSALVERLSRRSQRLAVTQAISQLNRVDRRLLTLFWHLAERWGRMTVDGVLIPLTLSHRMLSQLIGARRPTVSTALGELVRDEQVRRLDNGTWLLTGQPVGEPAGGSVRLVPPRRRLLPTDALPEHPHVEPDGVGRLRPAHAPSASRADLNARLNRLHPDGSRMAEELRTAHESTSEVCRRAQEQRTRRVGAGRTPDRKTVPTSDTGA